MESGKRKREDGTEPPAADRGGEKAAVTDDDEVEEFFAILRRMRAAAECLKKSDGGSGDLAAAEKWRPEFEAEDFGDFDGGKAAEERAVENKDDRVAIGVAISENSNSIPKSKSKLGLDLNRAPSNDDVL